VLVNEFNVVIFFGYVIGDYVLGKKFGFGVFFVVYYFNFVYGFVV